MLSFKNIVKEATLYVNRPLLNMDDLHKWAITNGFETTIQDMHVTIAFSKSPVRWSKFTPETNKLKIIENNNRSMKKFGEAYVLTFSSEDLSKRFKQFIAGGC